MPSKEILEEKTHVKVLFIVNKLFIIKTSRDEVGCLRLNFKTNWYQE